MSRNLTNKWVLTLFYSLPDCCSGRTNPTSIYLSQSSSFPLLPLNSGQRDQHEQQLVQVDADRKIKLMAKIKELKETLAGLRRHWQQENDLPAKEVSQHGRSLLSPVHSKVGTH